MNNPISRATVMALFCITLSGCAVGIKSTNLKVVPSKPEETHLLKSVGYVFHDEVYVVRNRKQMASEKKFIASEKESWIDALTAFTDKENIFIISDGQPVSILTPPPESAKTSPNAPPIADDNPSNMAPDNTPGSLAPDSKPASETNPFTEFAKTHPVVHVYVKAAPEETGQIMDNVVYGTFWMTFLSFGITPAYLPIPYTASFTLSMPDDKQGPPAHWDYPYDRQEFYWLPILIPMGDYLESINSEDEMDIRWKVEEKRRLVLMFLRDAKPLLQGQ